MPEPLTPEWLDELREKLREEYAVGFDSHPDDGVDDAD